MLADVLALDIVDLIERTSGHDVAGAVDRMRTIDRAVPQLIGPEHVGDRAFELLAGERVVGALMLEAQQSPVDEKHLTWPLYWAMLRKRVGGAPTWLVVVTTEPEIEREATATLSQVIPAAGCWLVLGLGSVPRVVEESVARTAPALVLISAVIHAGTDDVELVPAIAVALLGVAPEVSLVSYDILCRRLSAAAEACLEDLVELKDYKFQSTFALQNQHIGLVKGREEGRVDGLRDAVTRVLGRRGFALTAEQHAIIASCVDVAQLEQWLDLAAVAPAIEQVFARG